jgi:hypothetical protein
MERGLSVASLSLGGSLFRIRNWDIAVETSLRSLLRGAIGIVDEDKHARAER